MRQTPQQSDIYSGMYLAAVPTIIPVKNCTPVYQDTAMKPRPFPLLSLLQLALVFLACSDPTLDPDKLPYKLEVVVQHGQSQIPVDLNGDGRDELISFGKFDLPDGEAINIREFDGDIIEQVNFGGKVERPRFLHLDSDRVLEILVPFVRHDSLFVRVLDHMGNKQELIFLTEGESRREDEGGEIPWDPHIINFYLVDINNDGKKELVSVVFTGYARLPRGVFAHAFPEGYPMGKHIVGAAIKRTYLGDFDVDGRPEVAFYAPALGNGSVYGGVTDLTSHIGVFDLDERPSLQWSDSLGNTYDKAELLVQDFTGDGKLDFLVAPLSKRKEPVEIRLLDPATRQVYRRLQFNEPIVDIAETDLNRDGTFEFLISTSSSRVSLIDGSFQTVQQYQLADNERGLVAYAQPGATDRLTHIIGTRRNQGWQFRDQAFRPIAFLPTHPQTYFQGFASDELDEAPYLHFYDPNSNQTVFYSLKRNSFHWAYRYGPYALGFTGVGILLWMTVVLVPTYRRQQLMADAGLLVQETDARGILLAYPDRSVEPVNSIARTWLGTNGRAFKLNPTLLQRRQPDLAEFLEEATQPPARRQSREVSLLLDGNLQKILLVAEPLPREGYWLVLLGDIAADKSQLKAWALMAQRVAHDLMNPLTSIRLTLQHLQMDIHELAPDEAASFDTHVERIGERMEALRRMAHNFMKFVDQRELVREETNLNAFAMETCEGIAEGFPRDINVQYRLKQDLPPLELDREQMASVLENLLGNAVHAMPEGGVITIKSHQIAGLHFAENPVPRDYVTLEIQDTGVGITKTDQSRLFEPGFTTREEGTGLGLSLVKKIITDHGGHTQVHSEQGLGTAICLFLPIPYEHKDLVGHGLQGKG